MFEQGLVPSARSNSPMIRNLAIGALAATSAFIGVAAPAEAGHINGYEVIHLYDSGSYGGWDQIGVVGPNGVESISVRCAPFNWESYGANTARFAESIAYEWCF